MKSEEFCDTCYYRKICSQGYRGIDEDCPTYRSEYWWGVFNPETTKVEHAH